MNLKVISFMAAALWVLVDYYHLKRCFRKSTRRKAGFIYFFSDLGQLIPTVKIGRAKNDKQRMASHRTAAPFGVLIWLSYPVGDDVAAEGALHRHYKALRVRRNGEWFYLTPFLALALLLINLELKILNAFLRLWA